jgi:plastocyanin
MKLKYKLKDPLMIVGTVLMLSVYAIFAMAAHRFKIPLGMFVVLIMLSLLSVHIVLSLLYAVAYTMPTSQHGNEVKMISLQPYYVPDKLTIHVGEKVTFKNTDGVAHTVTIPSANLDTSVIQAGGEGQLTFNTPGQYTYYCMIHNYMSGTIDVLK